MKYEIMMDMLFTLLRRRKMTAPELAAKYNISARSVYRYVDEMTVAGLPIDVMRGPSGGIYISNAYKLPKGLFTREEYDSAVAAMQAMESTMDSPALRSAIEKLTSHQKSDQSDSAISGNILIDGGTWGNSGQFAERLSVIERAVNEREALEIDYVSREGNKTRRVILPHLLVYKQNIWYVFAFCRMRDGFRLFKIGRMRTILRTGKIFERLPFSREDIPLSFWTDREACVEARFALSEETIPFAEEWLGVEAVYQKDGKNYAEATLPDDESLVGKILSAGAGFTVLSPASLADRVRAAAESIAKRY